MRPLCWAILIPECPELLAEAVRPTMQFDFLYPILIPSYSKVLLPTHETPRLISVCFTKNPTYDMARLAYSWLAFNHLLPFWTPFPLFSCGTRNFLCVHLVFLTCVWTLLGQHSMYYTCLCPHHILIQVSSHWSHDWPPYIKIALHASQTLPLPISFAWFIFSS